MVNALERTRFIGVVGLMSLAQLKMQKGLQSPAYLSVGQFWLLTF
jgi:hypothetical protein